MRSPDQSGELALLLAILERAVLDAVKAPLGDEPGRARIIKSRAIKWITYWGNPYTAAPFSFPWICIELNLDPFEIRTKVLKLIGKTPGRILGTSVPWLTISRRFFSREDQQDNFIYY